MKNNVFPCKPQFYYINVELKGVKLYRHVFVMYSELFHPPTLLAILNGQLRLSVKWSSDLTEESIVLLSYLWTEWRVTPVCTSDQKAKLTMDAQTGRVFTRHTFL